MKILCLIILTFIVCGCSNPYFNPDTSKALTEISQAKELKEQGKTLERIAIALEKIAIK